MDISLGNGTDQKNEKNIVDTILYFVTIILSYKWFIIIITAVVGIGVAVFLFFTSILPPEKSPLPNLYSARINLYVQSEGNSGLESFFYSFRESPYEPFYTGIDVGELAVSLIFSGSFLDILAEELEIEKKFEIKNARKLDYRNFIISRLGVNYDRRRSTLSIECEDIYPDFAAKMVNLIAEKLIKWFSETGGTKKSNLKHLLEEKLVTVSEEIAKLETRIQGFQKKYGILTTEELATIHSDMMRDLNNQLLLKELEIRNYSKLIRVDDSRSRRLKIERENILELIKQIENGYTGTGRVLPPKTKVPDLLLEFNQLNMDLQVQRNIYDTLLEQYEISKLSAGVNNVFQILEWAEIPEEKSGPSRIQILAIAMGVIFFGSIGLSLLFHFLKKMKGPKLK